MLLRSILFYCIFPVVVVSCATVTGVEKEPALPFPSFGPATPQVHGTIQAGTPATLPTKPTAGIASGSETESSWKGNPMPVFLEITRTTIINMNSVPGPALGVGPTLYFYNSEDKVLLLHSTVNLDLKTEVVIGIADILQIPGQVFEQREVVQYPSMQPVLIQIASFDLKTGETELVYEKERFRLSPGESRTFKQAGSSTVVTSIVNHGRLIDIQPVESDGNVR